MNNLANYNNENNVKLIDGRNRSLWSEDILLKVPFTILYLYLNLLHWAVTHDFNNIRWLKMNNIWRKTHIRYRLNKFGIFFILITIMYFGAKRVS